MFEHRIVVDLTPICNYGELGGAQTLAYNLLPTLARIAPNKEFIILGSEQIGQDMFPVKIPNIRWFQIDIDKYGQKRSNLSQYITAILHKLLFQHLPYPLFQIIKHRFNQVAGAQRQGGITQSLHADLLFCPFTAPLFWDPLVPTVTIIHDLQFLSYPQFFNQEQLFYFREQFEDAIHLSSHIITVSNYVKQTVLRASKINPDRVSTIYNLIYGRLRNHLDEQLFTTILEKYRLKANRFLIYPANFWPHKNHDRLFTAYNEYRSCYPDSDLKLVCMGSGKDGIRLAQSLIISQGLSEYIECPGYIPDSELAVLFSNCKALIFPSLHEGFGMPVLEAMAFGKPVLCSYKASLPEVAGDGAFYFDPENIAEMKSVIVSIEHDEQFHQSLIRRSKARILQLGDKEHMAGQYNDIFDKIIMRNKGELKDANSNRCDPLSKPE